MSAVRPRHLIVTLLVAAAALWVYPAPSYWIFTANQGLIMAASALGLMVVVGWSKEVSLMQAGLTGTAAFLSAHAFRSTGWNMPYILAALVGIAVVVGISVIVSLATARLSGIYIMILTLAVQVTIEKVLFTKPWLVDPSESTPRPTVAGIELTDDKSYYLFSLAVVLALVVFLFRLRKSKFGRSLILAGVDRQAASSVGVSPWRAKIAAFALAGLCAGIAGALTSPLYGDPPHYFAFTALQSLFYLAIPVLAGFRSIVGVALVGLLFVLTPQALEPYRISPLIVGGVGLLLGTLAGASGASGLILDQVRAIKRRRAGKVIAIDLAEVDLAAAMRESSEAADQAVAEALARDDAYTKALEVLEGYLPQRAADGDLLVVDGVSIAFGGLKALSDVSLKVPARTLVGLIGPNGAGKSTLFDIINGLRRPDSGTITLFGEDVSDTTAWDRAKRGLSRTFQSSRVNLEITVADNLLAGAYKMIDGTVVEAVAGLPRARSGERKAEEAAQAVAHLLGLSEYFDEIVGNLDFGAQRRVEIGRSLMSGPRLLLLDEPAAGLDAHEAHALFALVRRLEADLGLTVLLVEHYVKAVLDNCDTVYVLSQGQIIAAGTPDEVAADEEVREVYLGRSFARRPQGVKGVNVDA